jgi:hypothetical protein
MLLRQSIRDKASRGAARHRSMEALSQNIGNERRAKTRYPVELEVRYRTVATRHPVDGTGRTLNMSSSGVFISSQNRINTDARIEVSIQWPFDLDGGIRLQMVAVGKVVRREELNFAVAFKAYQFRTLRRKPQSDAGKEVSAASAKANLRLVGYSRSAS